MMLKQVSGKQSSNERRWSNPNDDNELDLEKSFKDKVIVRKILSVSEMQTFGILPN